MHHAGYGIALSNLALCRSICFMYALNTKYIDIKYRQRKHALRE